MPVWEYDVAMARAATTSDVFNAIAEPQRREILVLLRAGERPVTELAQELGMTQPVHEWSGGFERFWNESFGRLDAYVQDLEQARQEE